MHFDDIEVDVAADEQLLLESENVTWIKEDIKLLEKLFLTTQGLYLAYSEKHGLFSKPTIEVIKKPLSEIKVSDNRLLAERTISRFENDPCLKIRFLDGTEEFIFQVSPRETATEWLNALYMVLLGIEAPVEEEEEEEEEEGKAPAGLTAFATSFKTATETAFQSLSDTAREVSDTGARVVDALRAGSQQNTIANTSIPPANVPQAVKFCGQCGTQLALNSKFCSNCGAPTAITNSSQHQQQTVYGQQPAYFAPVSFNPPPMPASPQVTSSIRTQEYAGAILKCPACGAEINRVDAICPQCGHRFTDQRAVTSVKEFYDRLMALEMNRIDPMERSRNNQGKRKGAFSAIAEMYTQSLEMMSMDRPDKVDEQKLSLIRSFPIPNTINDILEFSSLAYANIDVTASKKKFTRIKQIGSGYTRDDMPRLINDAWVAKLKQAYMKAKRSFPNDPAFEEVREIYLTAMKELGMNAEL